eukprot:701518-Hanusia_phi.AAC.1
MAVKRHDFILMRSAMSLYLFGLVVFSLHYISLGQPGHSLASCPIGTYSSTGYMISLEDCGSSDGTSLCSCTQSSYFNSSLYPCTNGYNNDIYDFILTSSEQLRWWRIDLGVSRDIQSVTIWPRRDTTFYYRDDNTSIYIGDNSDDALNNTLCGTTGVFTSIDDVYNISCTLRGRYLWTYKDSTIDSMNWAEIAIDGCTSCPASLNTTASTGSTSIDNCSSPCPPGYELYSDSCMMCPTGTYRTADMNYCTNCSTLSCAASEYFTACNNTHDALCNSCTGATNDPVACYPFPTNLVEGNTPNTGASIMTIFGSGLGSSEYSGQAQIGNSACESSTWESETSVACMVGAGEQTSMSAIVTILTHKGTTTNLVTYETPEISLQTKSNVERKGAEYISLIGAGLGTEGYSGEGR